MQTPVLQTDRAVVRMAAEQDVPAVVSYFERNREHLAPWDPLRPDVFYTEEFWRGRVGQNLDEFHLDISCRMFVFEPGVAETIVGLVNFSQIFRGSFHACYLGYSIDKAREGRGLMAESLRAGIGYMFERQNLHRVMANYVPRNVRSGRILRRLGFVPEGYARNYLMINGRWEDHILTSLTNPSWEEEA